MSRVTVLVLTTVNAPFGTSLSAEQLASRISDPDSVERHDPSVFTFFSDVRVDLQESFLDEMHIDRTVAIDSAARFSKLAGYALPLSEAGLIEQFRN